MDGSKRSLVYAAAIIGLALRLAFAFGYWVGEPLTRDEREYLSLARSVAAGDGFVYDADLRSGQGDPFGRPPGYPAFIAVVAGARGVDADVPASVRIAQAAIGALGVLLVAALAGRIAGPRAAVAAAFIAACYPPLVAISARAFSEAIFWPLGLAVAWLFDRTAVDPRRGAVRGLACGALAGLAVLVRPGMLFFLPLAAAWLLWRRQSMAGFACLLGAALVIGPWTARNYAHYGRFVLVASEGGVTFWTGNHPLARGDGDLAANPELARAKQALRQQHPGLTEEAMEPVYYREAFDWIRAHPIAWLGLEAKKLFYLVVPIGPSYTLHSPRYYAASAIPYALLLPFVFVGLRRKGADHARAPGLWLLGASAIAVCLVFFSSERFRIPVIDPALIVAAGAAWASGRSEEPVA